MGLTQDILAQELEQSKNDSLTSATVTMAFFCHVKKKSQCKLAGCPGKPILKHCLNVSPTSICPDAHLQGLQGPSDVGKNMFVGCSHWNKTKEYDHTYIGIQSSLDEDILAWYMAGELVADVDEDEEPSCSRFVHPCHGKQSECPHSHFHAGKLVVGQMVHHKCPVKKITYTLKDPDIKIVVVIFHGHHSHLPWPMEKPGLAVKADLDEVLSSMGIFGTTGRCLNNSATTRTVLKSDLDVKHLAFQNKRKLRDAVLSCKDASTPAGLLWVGVLDQYEQDLKLSIMDSYLANLIHKVQYLVPDFTFKHVKGELNEWEVSVWLDRDKECVSVAQIYCNKATQEAFLYIFNGFFMAVKQVTGQAVHFKVFNPKGNILSINFNMEAAQVQGFVQALLKLLGDTVPTTDPDMIFLDWYEHKIHYSWLLLCYNEALSLFPAGFWDRMPHHTNLVESAHVATNHETGTRLLPLEAIQKARTFDMQYAAAITTTHDTCILSNLNNDDTSRMRRAIGHHDFTQKYREGHTTIESGLIKAIQELADLSAVKKAATEHMKMLKEEKNTMGHAPHNIHLTDKDGNAARILQVFSLSSVSSSILSLAIIVDEESDSDVQIVESARSEGASSSYLQGSTPLPSGASNLDEMETFLSLTSELSGTSVDFESELESGHGEDSD
ncbi:hypothetical protein B0H10DRAFT_2207185 [Mycena sp. CBHHK59/15]|nr:hypothetical protein B0H10DRAFT_2207185 [Mycena sp. CBHHK59/15]